MYKRALSAYWKLVKKTDKHPYRQPIFYRYIWSKIWNCQPDIEYLDAVYKILAARKDVRRIRA